MKANSRTDMLEERSQRCVCRYCGGKLQVRSIVFNEIIDARTELECSQCHRIEFGVEREVYQSARYFVDETGHNAYPDMDESESTRQMSIAKVCDIMEWVLKNFGIVDEEGYTMPLNINENLLGRSIHLTDEDLKTIADDAEG